MNRRLGTFTIVMLVVSLVSQLSAQTVFAQQRELTLLKRNVSNVSRLIRRNKLIEASKVLTDAEKKLEKIVKDYELNSQNSRVRSLKKLIVTRRNQVRAKQIKQGSISYTKHIAPILKKNCIRCHSNKPKGGLRLDTLPALRRGGKNGAVVVAGNPNKSRLMNRLIAKDKSRMPKNAGPLSPDDIDLIARWIRGSKELLGPIKKRPNVKIAVATGNEKVSFKRDIAPFMVNLCLNCHNDRRKNSGFSMQTFQKLMNGGNSGQLVIPGSLEKSRMWDLAGKQDPIKMPQGQRRITVSNHRNLRIWIQEGAKFDGGDPTKPLRSLVPTAAEIRAKRLAKLSPAEFLKIRKTRQEEIWRLVTKREKPKLVEGKEFMVYGNVSAARLSEIGSWAEEFAKSLRKTFRIGDGLIFRGKLTIFVLRERFYYDEFNLSINRREAPREMTGHAVVEKNYEDAYVALLEVGDETSKTNPGLKANLIRNLTDAYLKRDGVTLPLWLSQGTGTMMAARSDRKNLHFKTLEKRVAKRLESVTTAEAVFKDGTFSPSEVGEVGDMMVEFLIKNGGMSKYLKLLEILKKGTAQAKALQQVYKFGQKKLGQAFFASIRKGLRKRRRR